MSAEIGARVVDIFDDDDVGLSGGLRDGWWVRGWEVASVSAVGAEGLGSWVNLLGVAG